jgi:hypothetical protein
MAKCTQIVCIHEGTKGASIDPVFANAFLKSYDPEWVRPWKTGVVRFVACRGKSELLDAFPKELQACEAAGGDTTLIVLADVDDDLENSDELKKKYWETAQKAGISKEIFEKAVFIFPKDRIENWVEFLSTGKTDEGQEGPRVKNNVTVVKAAQSLAERCRASNNLNRTFPPSLEWSCRNWRLLVNRMK